MIATSGTNGAFVRHIEGPSVVARRDCKELAAHRMRFGYRRLTAMLAREGVTVNHKRVYRLYREEGLAMRIRQRRRIRWSGAVIKPAAARRNERWSMDFVSDCVSRGKVIRMLTIVDDCTRECPAIEVDTSLGGLRVRRVLDRIAWERGLPEAIVLDNGPEFRGRVLAAWSEQRGVRSEVILGRSCFSGSPKPTRSCRSAKSC